MFPDEVEVVGVQPNAESVQETCEDASVIFNCFEPRDGNMGPVVAEMTSKMLLAAIEYGSKFVLASHLFNSTSDNLPAETDAMSTHRSGFAATVVARFPQMYGPSVTNALFDSVFQAVNSGRKAYWLGSLKVPRSYIYVGDAAASLVLLAESELGPGQTWDVAGPGPLTGRQFIEIAFETAGKEKKVGCWGRGLMIPAQVFDSRAKKSTRFALQLLHRVCPGRQSFRVRLSVLQLHAA